MDSRFSSTSRNWKYDVFPSFRGEDVRKPFLSHFRKGLKLQKIISFEDNTDIRISESISPSLVTAIQESRIAVLVFSKNYASSSWCLNELLEIMECKEKLGQFVIPIFYDLDPGHIRKQSGVFGEAFNKTCLTQTEEKKNQWKKALTDAANMKGYHSKNYNSEATMNENIAADISSKLDLTPTTDFKEFVGIQHHITRMRWLLDLKSKEVRMFGIWGMSGIGKTTIARALYENISSEFQLKAYIDRGFISKCNEGYDHRANFYDHDGKSRLQENFMSEILGRKNMKIGGMEVRLKHEKVLIVIDDLDDQYVLTSLAQTEWFGDGSRIIVVTTNKHLLSGHGIYSTYEVSFPSTELALEIFSRSAYKQNSPPDDLMKFAYEVVELVGHLPLGLNILGSSLRSLNKKKCLNMLPRLRGSLDRNIMPTLTVSYDGLVTKDKEIFRHIACLFNHVKKHYIKLFLADSELDVGIGLKNLKDRSIIYIDLFSRKVTMHRLLQDMGKDIVRKQSDEPGKREFLIDSKDIYSVLKQNTGTHTVLGMTFDTSEIDELRVHESAFESMFNLRFLKIYSMRGEEDKLQLPESFELPSKLKYLYWSDYPIRRMPSTFRPENLVQLLMPNSKLDKLWEGALPLTCLKKMSMRGSKYLREIPDLTMATNLEKLNFAYCSLLVELPSSIRNLKHLRVLNMDFCTNLETLPTDIDLEGLEVLCLEGCSRLKSFPHISTSIEVLYLNDTAIEEVPWWILDFYKLKVLDMSGCRKLEYEHFNIHQLRYGDDLYDDDFSGCDCVLTGAIDNFHGIRYGLTEDDDPKLFVEYELKQSVIFNSLELPSEEVPSYFTHRTTGTSMSMTHTLVLHTSPPQTFIRFEVGVVVSTESMSRTGVEGKINVTCCFKGVSVDVFDPCWPPHAFIKYKEDSLHILNFCIPLEKGDPHCLPEQVDMEIKISTGFETDFIINGWGVRILDEECKYCAAETERMRQAGLSEEDIQESIDSLLLENVSWQLTE